MSTPDQPARADRPVREAVRSYAALQPGLVAPTEHFVELITTLLDDAGINYLSVTGRTKSVASFAAKANRATDGQPMYPDPLNEITDQIGIRVITYVHSDVAAVAELLDDELTILDDRDMGQETARAGGFGYASRHLLVTPDPPDDESHLSPYDELRGHRASVQVRTVLQHAWAEFEHDIRYKGTVPEEHVPDLDRRFTLAAGLLELADREFSTIRERLQAVAPASPGEADPSDPRISGQDLASFLAGAVCRRRLVAHRSLRLDRRPPARARHHLAGRARRPAHLGRRRRHHPTDGLPLPGGCRAAPRRRPARDLRTAVRRSERQRPPGGQAHRPAREAELARRVIGTPH